MSETRKISKLRRVLIWAINLLIIPFGFLLEDPVKEIDAFLP